VFKEFYHNSVAYLMGTFDAKFIFITLFITTIASIVYVIALSYIITRMDKRYFVSKKIVDKKAAEHDTFQNSHLLSKNNSTTLVVNIVKIIFGISLLVCGIAMLVLPGQGLITILVALSLIPFPGKKKLEHKLLKIKSVRFSLNWIRIKAKKEPFIFD